MLSALDSAETTNIATQCIRSNLLSSPKNACDIEIVRALLPYLLSLTAKLEPPYTASIGALLPAFLPSLAPEQREVAMALFVPVFLECARKKESARKDVAARLLELASADAMCFTEIVRAMKEPQRQFLGSVLKTNQGQKVKREEREGPSIELKMEFETT